MYKQIFLINILYFISIGNEMKYMPSRSRRSKKHSKCSTSGSTSKKKPKVETVEIVESDVVINPTSQGYLPGGAGFASFIGIVVYILGNPILDRPGPLGWGGMVNRVQDDIQVAREIWGIPFVRTRIELVNPSEIGLTQNDLICSRALEDKPAFQRMLTKRHNDGFNPDWITVWYVPFQRMENAAGCAPGNRSVQFPNGSKSVEYQHIIMTNSLATNTNRSALAHELGHILFQTVPGANGKDPSSNFNDDHSPLENNVMWPIAGNRRGVTDSQIQHALKSRLLPQGILPPSGL